MTTSDRFDSDSSPRPALSGELGPDYELRVSGGGSEPREFVPPSEVRDVFSRGIRLLNERLETTDREYRVGATMARVRLRPRAAAKSHRDPTLFDRRRFQVAGVQQPGDILALVTQSSINVLTELVENATQRQLKHLSAVAEVIPYDAPIERGETRSVVTLFDGILDDGTSLQGRGLERLQQRGVELSPYGKAPNVYTTSSLPPDQILRNMPWLREVRPVRRFRSAAHVGTTPVLPSGTPPPNQLLHLPIVGVVDSGIDRSIPWLRSLLVAHESHIPAQYTDQTHGSLVGSLAATGGGFTLDPNYFPNPKARLLDIQALGGRNFPGIDEDDLLAIVENAVQRYGPRSFPRSNSTDEPVVIWNLSLETDLIAEEGLFSTVATELDRIALENSVLFTIAAGNYKRSPLRGWRPGQGPDYVANGEDRISPPADSVLAVSVGSLSDTSNPPTASPAEYPSPFSRRGPGPGMLIKPDVVHYGGTCEITGNSAQGILGPYRNGAILEDIGTSFATPRVAAQLAELVGILPNSEPELLKLLLLLSCTSRGDHDVRDRELVNYYGFGVPDSPAALLTCDPSECTMLFRGELRPGLNLQTPFPFPPSLIEDGKIRGLIRMGLVYTPVLDVSKGAEYCQTNVEASFGRQINHPQRQRYQREVYPLPYKHRICTQWERDLIDQVWKWSPTKLYERKFTRTMVHPNEICWRLSLRLLLRRELEERRDEVRQSFWLGIKFTDPEGRGQIYQEMRQQIEAEGLAQPIVLRQQVRAQ